MPESRAQPIAFLTNRQWLLPWVLLLPLTFSFTLVPTAAHAQTDQKKTREQLQQLEKDIKRINRELATAGTQRNKLQEQLRKAEKELGAVQRKIADTRRSLRSNEQELAELQKQHGKLEQARDEQQKRIAVELKTAWQMGRQGQMKVLLNQEDPQTVTRSLAYYRYFLQARNDLLDRYRDTLAELQQLQQDIDTTLDTLTSRRENLEQQQTKLTTAQSKRELAILEVNANISSKSEQLKQKEANRKELESLLDAIEEAIDKLEMPDNYQAFASAKGKMPWPVTGKHSNSFGRPRNEGKMRWQGLSIPAKEGTAVRAIHHGRVVYADWLRGSGLLLIIDHGDGYMSLYAHNQSLLKDVGEWVTADTPISTVGNTGGQDRTALYFEIRHDGKPTDPARWCKG